MEENDSNEEISEYNVNISKSKDKLTTALVTGLRNFYSKEWPKYCDFTIQCCDGSVEAARMFLEISSEYFQAFFRQNPEAKEADLCQFDSETVNILVKSIVSFDDSDLDSCDVFTLLQAADYLQMKEMSQVVAEKMITLISKDNIENLMALGNDWNLND